MFSCTTPENNHISLEKIDEDISCTEEQIVGHFSAIQNGKSTPKSDDYATEVLTIPMR